jgi:molybdopterin molybdotransferase
MITPSEASTLIEKHAYSPAIESVSLNHAMGRTLAEDISADRDYPPFNRACMDGYAINGDSWEQGQRQFELECIIRAGDEQYTLKDQHKIIEIMTGAPTPIGCDRVVRVEDSEVVDGKVSFGQISLGLGKNIHPTGTDYKKGDVLISKGTVINSTEIGILASNGYPTVQLLKLPQIAIISTGDELVDIDNSPLPHQIRRSNSYQISASIQKHNLGSTDHYHYIDNEEILSKELKTTIANYDIIILSGGVSMGKFDFIPKTLKSIGIEEHFHKIAQKPGKPMWFGSKPNGPLVFGLPGNPVSAAVCLGRYILPSLSAAFKQPLPTISVQLLDQVKPLAKLENFIPICLSNKDGKVLGKIKPTKGSGDFASLSQTDGFIEVPHGGEIIAEDTVFNFYSW